MLNLSEEYLVRAETYFHNEFEEFIDSLSKSPTLSIRLNPLKPNNQFENNEIVPWCKEGRYFSSKFI